MPISEPLELWKGLERFDDAAARYDDLEKGYPQTPEAVTAIQQLDALLHEQKEKEDTPIGKIPTMNRNPALLARSRSSDARLCRRGYGSGMLPLPRENAASLHNKRQPRRFTKAVG